MNVEADETTYLWHGSSFLGEPEAPEDPASNVDDL